MTKVIEHPDFKTPIKTWWKGHYEHFFIALHPFFKIRSLASDHATKKLYDQLLTFEERPQDFDDVVKLRGEPIKWSAIHEAVGAEVPKIDFYRAIWLAACLGFTERANISLQKRILSYCEAHNIYLPQDDFMPSILHPVIQRFLLPFENKKILAYDEFRDNMLELPLSSLEANAPTAFIKNSTTSSGLWAIHVPDPGILISSAFDGTEALIAMTSSAFEQSDPTEFFETEPVDDDTYCDWLNPKDFFSREDN